MADQIRKCDILFVNPPSPDGHIYIRDINRSGRRSRERTIWPQTSMAYLAAVAKKAGYSVAILDCIAIKMNWQQYLNYIRQATPKWTVVQAISSVMTNDVYATYLSKRYGSKTIVVGPHITALPQQTLQVFPTIDYGIVGEAEETLEEFLKTIDSGGQPDEIKGIVYRKGEQILVNPERSFIENLDSLPIPLHELLPIDKYSLPYIGKKYTFVLHSRGCPNSCHFCRQTVMWKSEPRLRSPESICKELKYLNELGIINIMFHSDTFTQDRENVIGICKQIIRDNLKVRWICNGRVDRVDPEMLDWMKKAGCWMINYGIESGSQDILDKCNKGENITVELARQAVLMTKEAGIKVWGYFIIGLVGETKKTIEQTSKFARSLPLDIVNFAVGAPYPGTEFYRQVKENSWLESDNWEDFDQNYSAIVSYPALSSKEIMEGIRKCYLQWFMRPRGICVFLKGMTSLHNIVNMARLAISHLMIKKT
ncbi:MAG: radical SAM protein [Planctomycetes bacterium]|nr:radical SAM protein [Planctomycetota bacterium]